MPINAVRHVHQMRGCAQAQLIEADDGHWYVVKFRNNPQHRRVLVNELVASTLLGYLQIATPPTALVQVGQEFLEANPGVGFTLGTERRAAEAGWHFGSRYPGDPSCKGVYDYLPDPLLAKVVNLPDFRAILAFDQWVSNSDGRQMVSYRAVAMREEPVGAPGWVVRMIDNGFAFNGSSWAFSDSPLHGLYPRRVVYDAVRSIDDFEPWLSQIVHLPEDVIDRAWKSVPAGWLRGDEDAFLQLLERLFERRKRVPELLWACWRSKLNPFPNWHYAAHRAAG